MPPYHVGLTEGHLTATAWPVCTVNEKMDNSANFRYSQDSERRLFAQSVGYSLKSSSLLKTVFGRNLLLEFFEFASVYVRIKSQMIRYGAGQGDNLSYLGFREQPDLKVEIGMLAVSLGHAISADEDEGCLSLSRRFLRSPSRYQGQEHSRTEKAQGLSPR
jgi:hypothetical protein